MVHDDPIAVLERELVRAARRMGAGEETVSLPGARRAPNRSRGAVAVLLSTAAVIAIVLGAVVALGGHNAAPPPDPGLGRGRVDLRRPGAGRHPRRAPPPPDRG